MPNQRNVGEHACSFSKVRRPRGSNVRSPTASKGSARSLQELDANLRAEVDSKQRYYIDNIAKKGCSSALNVKRPNSKCASRIRILITGSRLRKPTAKRQDFVLRHTETAVNKIPVILIGHTMKKKRIHIL